MGLVPVECVEYLKLECKEFGIEIKRRTWTTLNNTIGPTSERVVQEEIMEISATLVPKLAKYGGTSSIKPAGSASFKHDGDERTTVEDTRKDLGVPLQLGNLDRQSVVTPPAKGEQRYTDDEGSTDEVYVTRKDFQLLRLSCSMLPKRSYQSGPRTSSPSSKQIDCCGKRFTFSLHLFKHLLRTHNVGKVKGHKFCQICHAKVNNDLLMLHFEILHNDQGSFSHWKITVGQRAAGQVTEEFVKLSKVFNHKHLYTSNDNDTSENTD